MTKRDLILCACMLTAPVAARAQGLVDVYKDLHTHPELSHHEERTSAIVAKALRAAGYAVTERVGKYPDGSQAYGVVGILKNGAGPMLLVRGDMDSLPIVEETGLPYTSKVESKNAAGQTVGVMQACGHDVHTTVLIGTAQALAAAKTKWHGTLMIVGQPSEETIDGAKAMLADGLYQRFGTPDHILGLHDTNTLAAGTVSVAPGPMMASSTSIDVVIKGIGGHGAYPQLGRDPIVLAAQYITQIQTIVAREQDPQDPAVITVGHIMGGTKRNIIPDEVQLELTTRSFTKKAKDTTIKGLKDMAAGITLAANLPPEKAATVTVLVDESTPPEVNDAQTTTIVRAALESALGKENVLPEERVMGSEDVGIFGDPEFNGGKAIPVVYFRLGAMDPSVLSAAVAKGTLPPGMHTNRFAPVPQPTLDTGVKALTTSAMALLQ
jgi:hippurate hydrolase